MVNGKSHFAEAKPRRFASVGELNSGEDMGPAISIPDNLCTFLYVTSTYIQNDKFEFV